MTGPVLYDLASAVMYLGSPERAEHSYLDQRILSPPRCRAVCR